MHSELRAASCHYLESVWRTGYYVYFPMLARYVHLNYFVVENTKLCQATPTGIFITECEPKVSLLNSLHLQSTGQSAEKVLSALLNGKLM